MKRTLATFASEVCATSCLLGQMAGMATPDGAAIPVTRPSNVTFAKDVAPIVQQHCQGCHRPGEGAPFSMLTYEDARPWATAMKRMVVTRAMPPWFEDGHTEKFENNRSLTQAQIDTIAAWVVPAGSRIECTAHYNNSAKNPGNPDPSKTITWGQQSFDEMMVCFFNVAFPADTPSKDLLPLPENETAARTP